MFEIESKAMEFLLAGDDRELEILRDQFNLATVSGRENTGVGFFTKFRVPDDRPRLARRGRIVIGDVYGEVEENPDGVGFLLFVEDGVMDTLECFSNYGPVKEDPQLIRLFYVNPGECNSLIETPHRNLDWALDRK